MRSVLIAVLVAVSLTGSACGSKQDEPAAPPTVPGQGGPGGEGVASASASANSIAPTIPPESGGGDEGGGDEGGEETGEDPTESSLPEIPLVTVGPPPTYDEALRPWCDALGDPIIQASTGVTAEDVRPLVAVIDPLRASLPFAPPEMLEPTNRLIGVLELLRVAIDSGEVTDKESMIRWGLVNLAPDQIGSLQTDLITIASYRNVSCPPA